MAEYGVSRNREPESCATTANCPCATINPFHGKEALKDARKVGAVNSDAVINNRKPGLPATHLLNLNLHTAGGTAVLDRVMNEVRYRLA